MNMAAALACLACAATIIVLWRRDARRHGSGSWALWIPLIWMFLAGSRWVSAWLGISPSLGTVQDYAEGSPLDRMVFAALMAAAAWVIWRRRLDWGALLFANRWLALYMAFCATSALWADDPSLSFKRWFKDLGAPLMALVILTDRHPARALRTVLTRLALLWLPLSALFIRYFPQWGRVFHVDGLPMYTGVGQQKNDLGLICLETGLLVAWLVCCPPPSPQPAALLQGPGEIGKARKVALALPRSQDRVMLLVVGGLSLWLLSLSNSRTALGCLILGAITLAILRHPAIIAKPHRVIPSLGVMLVLLLALDASLDLKSTALSMMGRDASLTNRTSLWKVLGSISTDPWWGEGYMSFWSGWRMQTVWNALGRGINQAHSGYLEQFLNLGWVGVGFISLLGWVAVRRGVSSLSTDPSWSAWRLSVVGVILLYNYTEAAFYGVNTLWALFLISLIEVRPAWVRRP